MKLPDTREGLEKAGYTYSGEGRCRGCGVYLEWYITPPNKQGKTSRMPFTVEEVRDQSKGFFAPIERIVRICHFANCPKSDQFRKRDKPRPSNI